MAGRFRSRVALRDPDAIHNNEKPIRLLSENIEIVAHNPMLAEAHDGAWDRRRRREERERLAAMAASEEEQSSSEKDVDESQRKVVARKPAFKRFVYRPRITGIRVSDPLLLFPIQPWKLVRPALVTLISIKGNTSKESTANNFTQDLEDSSNVNVSHMTIPYGFQLIRQLVHSRPTLRNALYVPAATSAELFVTLDSHYVHIWRGTAKVKKYSTVPMTGASAVTSKKDRGASSSFENREEGAGAYGIEKLIFIEKFRLYVVFSNQLQLKIFDYQTGARLDFMKNIHEMSLTSCVFYEPLEMLITAGKCGKIKAWNSQSYLLQEFNEHYNSITSLLLVEKICDSPPGTIPLVISSSLDGTIRVWNFESGKCVYRYDTGSEILGMGIIKKDTFYHFCRKNVQIWNINRVQKIFHLCNSRALVMRRQECNNDPARLLVICEDGSVKLLNPVTAEVILTGFPTHKDALTKDAAYDYDASKLHKAYSEAKMYKINYLPFFPMEILSYIAQEATLSSVDFGLEKYEPPRKKDNNGDDDDDDDDDDDNDISVQDPISRLSILGGTASGQVALIEPLARGELRYLFQAHGEAVAAMRFDKLNKILITSGNDLTVKVWKLNGKKSEKGRLEIQAECQNVLNLENYRDFGILISFLCINPASQTIAIPWSGGVFICRFDNEGSIKPPNFSLEKSGTVTAIASSHTYDIWVTADREGLIKVWDSDGRVVREIQCLEGITSLEFANPRGDLLIGLRSQIAVVWMQDYLPVKYMRLAVTLNFQDDAAEFGKPFDSNLDFWEYCYQDEKKKTGGAIRWHIPKNMDLYKADALNNTDFMFSKTEVSPDDVVQKRRNRRLFLAREAGAFRMAEAFERRTAFIDHNAALSRNTAAEYGYENQIHSKSEESEKEDEVSRSITDDLIKITRIASETALLPVGVLRPESPSESIDYLTWRPPPKSKNEKAKRVDGDGPHIQEPRKKDKRVIDPNLEKSLQRPQNDVTKLTAEELERRREKFKRKLVNAGVALPNSVVKREAAEPELRSLRRNTMTRQPFSPMKNSLALQKSFTDNISDLNPADKPSVVPRLSIANIVKKSAAAPAVAAPPPPQPPKYVVPANRARGKQPPIKFVKAEDPEDILPVRDYDIFRRESSTSTSGLQSHRPSHFEIDVLQEIEDVKEDAMEVLKEEESEVENIDQALEQEAISDCLQAKPALVPKTPKVKAKGHSKKSAAPVKAEDVAEKVPEFKPKPPLVLPTNANVEIVGSPNRKKGLQKIDSISGSETSESTAESSKSETVESSQLTSQSPELSSSTDQTSKTPTTESIEDGSVEDLQYTSSKEAESYTWKMIRNRQYSFIPEALIKVSSMFWFPKMDGPMTLSNVIRALVQVVRHGLWSEICEASKALLYLHRTFKGDILDPMTLLIRPQLEALHNTSWQVRAQLCLNVASYDISNTEIISSIIHLLVDKHPEVRLAAMKALAQLDVNTKDKLLNFLIRSGMMPHFFGTGQSGFSHSDFLDELLRELDRREIASAAEACSYVSIWRDELPGVKDTIPRIDSFCEHLSGPIFPPDALRKKTVAHKKQRPRTSSIRSWINGEEKDIPGNAPSGGTRRPSSAYFEPPPSNYSSVMDGWDNRSVHSRNSHGTLKSFTCWSYDRTSSRTGSIYGSGVGANTLHKRLPMRLDQATHAYQPISVVKRSVRPLTAGKTRVVPQRPRTSRGSRDLQPVMELPSRPKTAR
ncbi:WD repeat-containing protein 87 [Phlyctochytrium planicorne]|nr:WD repeat-containing protein 87 [Phlyctochytrium planicorne]